jgi:hypothetical protein
MELLNFNYKNISLDKTNFKLYEVPLGKFIYHAPPVKNTLVLRHLSKSTETSVELFRVLPKTKKRKSLQLKEMTEIQKHLLTNYVNTEEFFLISEKECKIISGISTKLHFTKNKRTKDKEDFIEIDLTYSSKKSNWTDSEDEWLLALSKVSPGNLQEDTLVIRISGSRLLPKLTSLKTINISRMDQFSNSYLKLKFHQKSFDLSKIFLTRNKKLKNFLLKHNFINLKVFEKIKGSDNNICNSERAPHLFGSFKNRNQQELLGNTAVDEQFMQKLVSTQDFNALKEHNFKDYKLKNLSACSFSFFIKLVGPYFFDKSFISQVSEFEIKENQILSIRVYMKQFSKKLSSEWPMCRESLIKGVMLVSYFP